MKIKKFLSLLLFVTSLNLATNFTNCLGMVPDDYSVTEVTLSGFTNCPKCGAQRVSKISTHSDCYSSPCPVCGTYSRYSKCPFRPIASPNSTEACRYCGCRRFINNGKKLVSSENIQSYMCSNCKRTGFKKYLSYNGPQLWKKGFCQKNCEHIDGYVTGKLVAGRRDPLSNKLVKKEDRIKNILCNPNGFGYYCYTCQELKHVTLTKEQAERVCAEYDKGLSN